jgi:hypothetical protein
MLGHRRDRRSCSTSSGTQGPADPHSRRRRVRVHFDRIASVRHRLSEVPQRSSRPPKGLECRLCQRCA